MRRLGGVGGFFWFADKSVGDDRDDADDNGAFEGGAETSHDEGRNKFAYEEQEERVDHEGEEAKGQDEQGNGKDQHDGPQEGVENAEQQ